MIGINNRDLDDLTVDLETTAELITDVPAGKTVVSESGYDRYEQLEELERIGCDAVLIGETLMRSGDPEAAVRELTMDDERPASTTWTGPRSAESLPRAVVAEPAIS